MYLDILRYIEIIVLKYAEQETKRVHFSPCSRDQLKAHVLIYHNLLPSPAPSLVSNAAPTKSSACCCMQYGSVPVSPTGIYWILWVLGRFGEPLSTLCVMKALCVFQHYVPVCTQCRPVHTGMYQKPWFRTTGHDSRCRISKKWFTITVTVTLAAPWPGRTSEPCATWYHIWYHKFLILS